MGYIRIMEVTRFPRARGDRPGTDQIQKQLSEVPPRTRG